MLPSELTQPLLKESIISELKKNLVSETQEVIQYLESYPIENLNEIFKLPRATQEKLLKSIILEKAQVDKQAFNQSELKKVPSNQTKGRTS
jgi:hypothetical protein